MNEPTAFGSNPSPIADRGSRPGSALGGDDGGGIFARTYLGEVPGLEQASNLGNPSASDLDASSFVADDFLLQESEIINQLHFCGGYSPANTPFADDFTVRLHSDGGGLPSGEIVAFGDLSLARHASGRSGALEEHCYAITLPDPLALPGGHYWLEVANDSSGSDQTWAWLGGEEDAVSGRPGAAASSNGVNWSPGASDRALSVPFRTFTAENATFYWAEALWNRAVTSLERFDTTAENVALADEISEPPGANALLGTDILTFDRQSTGLARSFTLTQLEETELGWTFRDTEMAHRRFTLSPNDVNNGENDDFEITIDAGPLPTALGMTIVEEIGGSTPGLQSLTVYGADDVLIESLDLARVNFGRPLTFLGVVTKKGITRIVFDEDSGADDIGVRHFRFGVNAAPIFADGFESGDTAAWSATSP